MPLAIFAVVFALNAAWGSQRLARVERELASAPVLRVSFLQQNTTMEERMSEPAQKAFTSWVDITRKIEPLKPDLVVWPEGSFPGNPIQARDSELLGEIAREGNFDFLVGGGTYELNPPGSARRYTAYNSCYHYTPAGEQAGRYDKMRPLPFGEYLPLSDEFPFLKGLIEGIGDFRKGTVATVFHGAATRSRHPSATRRSSTARCGSCRTSTSS
jgi:apolipoprotein N-acyltransferase